MSHVLQEIQQINSKKEQILERAEKVKRTCEVRSSIAVHVIALPVFRHPWKLTLFNKACIFLNVVYFYSFIDLLYQ